MKQASQSYHSDEYIARTGETVRTLQQLPACQQLVRIAKTRSTYIRSCTNITLLQDEEMSWLDKSCLHLAVKKKDKIETVTFQVSRTQQVEKTTCRGRGSPPPLQIH